MYYDFLRNKKVAFVGPAPHLKGSNNGEKIDSYDIVVRPCCCYRIPEKLKKDWGFKINIWYATFSIFDGGYIDDKIIKRLHKRGLKWFCFSKPLRRTKSETTKNNFSKLKGYSKKYDISINFVNKNVHSLFKNKIEKPTTGIISICDLLQSELKELYISGITFYKPAPLKKKKMYYSGYTKDNLTFRKSPLVHHSPKKELIFFKHLLDLDKRIKCDDILMEIIENNS